MAYLRLGNIKENHGAGGRAAGLKRCIDYILNPSKTQNQTTVGSYNFVLGEQKGNSAFDTMIATKKLFQKEDGRQGYHFKLSFAADDKVPPEQAMELTYKFCEACFRDYECLYAVHDNTAHLHSHIVINSIDMVEGRKYHYKKGDWAKTIQPIVNDLCKQNGLSEINLAMDDDFILKHKCKTYSNWEIKNSKKRHDVFYTNKMIKADVDECISKANNLDEFKLLMEKKGHIVTEGKYIKVLAPGRSRPCRLYTLTPDKQTYTTDNIKRMIEGTYMSREEIRNKLVQDWNAYSFVRVKLQVVKIDVKLAKRFENESFAKTHDLHTVAAIDDYLYYLNQVDKELNIIKKQVQESMNQRQEVLNNVEELGALIKFYARYQKGDHRFEKEYLRVRELYNHISAKGYSLNELYQYKVTGELLVKNITDYKKHIYVETQICNRLKDDKNKSEKLNDKKRL